MKRHLDRVVLLLALIIVVLGVVFLGYLFYKNTGLLGVGFSVAVFLALAFGNRGMVVFIGTLSACPIWVLVYSGTLNPYLATVVAIVWITIGFFTFTPPRWWH